MNNINVAHTLKNTYNLKLLKVQGIPKKTCPAYVFSHPDYNLYQ